MTEITFVTSNKTKLAHARYLCRNYQVNVLYYRKWFYGFAYDEPRIDDRKQLLTESFNSAVARWKKFVSRYDERLFFIEDTSVKIDSLSDDEKEVPGVDVKYWMHENSFEKLDQELRARGNNRRCSVTSHLILFLTEELKTKLGTNEDYRVFTSTAYGTVTEKEYTFETQMLYPWLDNKTFNKWFVPEGFSQPVSMLDISDAEVGDFRKGAFEEMLAFLEDNGMMNNKHQVEQQLHFQFYNNFVVCGRTCAGKTTIGKYLVDKYGFYHIEASEFMTQKLLETHGTDSNVDKHLFAEKVLTVDPLFVVNKVKEYLQDKGIYDKFVITGFRTQDEVKSFVQAFHVNRLNVVFINTCFEKRCRRWMLRQRDADNYTEERFKEIDAVQETIGVGAIAEMDNVMMIDNDIEGRSMFYKRFRKKFLTGSRQEPISFNEEDFQKMKISLERAILITLALEYRKDENQSFTTTEISYLINQHFKDFIRSKNNVSRYFNQSYYVYYEVKYVNRKNRYRISPIGYSEAMMAIRNLKIPNEESV